MKVKTMSALAGLGGALIMSSSANAAFLGLEITSTVLGNGNTQYRVWATFNDPTDVVTTYGAGQGFTAGLAGDAFLQNLNAAGNGPGLGFVNVSGQGGNGLPTAYSSYAAATNDSYWTIGLVAMDQTPSSNPLWLVSNMPNLGPIASNLHTMVIGVDGANVLTTVPSLDGFNNNFWNAGSMADGRADAVLLMNLVVRPGEHIQGLIGLQWNPGGVDGGPVVETDLFFTSIPAPGALALLGLAGLVGSRRRRG